MTYILSPKRGAHYTGTDLAVAFLRRQRPTGRMIGGLFQEVEEAGRDENILEVFPRDCLLPDGRSGGRLWIRFRRSADAMHKRVRRLRPADVERLATIDAAIADLRLQIAAKQTERAAVVKAAWPRAKQVPLKEIVDQAPPIPPARGIGAALAQ